MRADRLLILSCKASYWRELERGGDDKDDPDILLQSSAALATSPLRDGSGDGSSSEETPSSPAFCLLRWLSLRSRLVVWRFMCSTLRTMHLFSVAALFWLLTVKFRQPSHELPSVLE
jgi:hypothetical protein